MNEIYEEDGRYIAQSKFIKWELLENSHILITGATGLIGATLIRGIMTYNERKQGSICVFAHVRNEGKATILFEPYIKKGWLKLIIGDILDKIEIEEPIDFIIHGASETASRAFVDKPVETICTAIVGSQNLLKLACEKQIKSMVYMSSMEIYGTPMDKTPLTENKMGYLDSMSVRSSYSESKRMVENLCASYVSEYHVPVKVARLTQTFGPGVTVNDRRVFAEFARCVTRGEDICLQTTGETRRMYLYTADAATALLAILTKGQDGEAYNVANTETYCSIYEMAVMVSREFGNGECQVAFVMSDQPNISYNPIQDICMDVSKIENLGWRAKRNLKEMYDRMIMCM